MSTKKRPHHEEMEDDLTGDDMDSSSDESEDEERHPEAYTGNELVQIDFEGRAPTDPDCHGISQLLSRLFLKAHINCFEMSSLIIGQNFVGSVIYQCESDDTESEADELIESDTIFGITTVLNITAKKDTVCIGQLRNYIVEHAKEFAEESTLKIFSDALSDQSRSVGFLINERFINIPAHICVPLFESLNKEIDTAKGKGMKFDFTYFIMVVKFYRKEGRKGKAAEDIYTNPEEEFICEKALHSFEFSVELECDVGMTGDWLEGDATSTPYRKVILLDAKNFPQLISDVKKFISDE